LLAKTRQIKAAFWVADIVLVMAAAAFAVNGVMHLRAPARLAGVAPPPLVDSASPQTSDGQSKVRPRAEYQSLAKSDLFGEQSRKSTPQPMIEETLPETTLDLELLGLVVATGSDPGYAIIRDKTKRSEDTYTVGDIIVGDARVEEIRFDAVVISRSGKRETLSMSFVGTGKQQKGRRGFPGGRTPPPSRRRPPRQRASSDEAIRVQNENMRYINKEKLMEEAGQNMASLIREFRTSPNIVDGKPNGIGINQVGTDPISSKSGLKPGDIVKSINGTRVNSMDDILAQAEKIKGKPEVRVVIERDGRHRTLVYKIR
jgi:type II secretion system protein C